MIARRLPVALLAVMLLAACAEKAGPQALEHEAYVWQRRWSPALAAALRDSADLVRAWRVLAGEVDAGGNFRRLAVDPAALAVSGRPAIPVVRIEAPLATLDRAQLIAGIVALQRDWPASTTIEIDHDCGTRQLADYARFLAALRQAIPSGRRLSLTVLPDWLAASELDGLLATADEIVLQLHSVHGSARSLFDPAGARAWTSQLARRIDKPFRVALPTYGSRVVVDERGRITAIESEVPVDPYRVAGVPDQGRELFAPPATVSAFLRWLEKSPPPRLSGVVWFRLPLAGDQRAWTPATWRAVIRDTETAIRLSAELRPGNQPGQQRIVLRNAGIMDTTLPATLIVQAPCRGLTGSQSYLLERQGEDSLFLRSQQALLRAGSEISVGLADCPSGPGGLWIDE